MRRRDRSPRGSSAIGVVTPVDVSLCTTHTALIAWSRSAREPRLDLRRVGAVAPVARHEVHDQPEPLGELLPQRREVAGLGHQHAIAGRQRVDERRLPRAGARRWIDDDRRASVWNTLLHAGEHRLAELPRTRGRDGRSSDGRSRAARGRARWSGPGICRKWRPEGWLSSSSIVELAHAAGKTSRFRPQARHRTPNATPESPRPASAQSIWIRP